MAFTLPGKFVVPEVVTSQFHLKEGDKVADFGAGSGFFLKALATAVGPAGKVYACEIQKPLVEKLGDLARLQGLSTVVPLWCDLEELGGIKLPPDTLDSGILVNTLFQLQLKEVALDEMYRVLRRGATLHIIDWSESFGGAGPQTKDIIVEEAAIKICESRHFAFEHSFPAGDHHYGFTVRKI
jgi:ubiquinone/menaquinone biosynthesis C-methylase UbiE